MDGRKIDFLIGAGNEELLGRALGQERQCQARHAKARSDTGRKRLSQPRGLGKASQAAALFRSRQGVRHALPFQVRSRQQVKQAATSGKIIKGKARKPQRLNAQQAHRGRGEG